MTAPIPVSTTATPLNELENHGSEKLAATRSSAEDAAGENKPNNNQQTNSFAPELALALSQNPALVAMQNAGNHPLTAHRQLTGNQSARASLKIAKESGVALASAATSLVKTIVPKKLSTPASPLTAASAENNAPHNRRVNEKHARAAAIKSTPPASQKGPEAKTAELTPAKTAEKNSEPRVNVDQTSFDKSLASLNQSSTSNLAQKSIDIPYTSPLNVPAAPLPAQVAEDPSLRLGVMMHAAHVSCEVDGVGDVALHLKVRDGVTDVRVDGNAAQLLNRVVELEAALANEGLQLGNFSLGQDGHQHYERGEPAAEATNNRREIPKTTRPTEESTTAPHGLGKVHLQA